MFCNRETKSRVALVALVVLVGLAQTAFAQWSNDPNVGAPICTSVGQKGYPIAVSDGASGIIVMWRERRGSSPDVFVQRLNMNGMRLWTADGVQISHATGYNGATNFGVVSDGLGGAIVVWAQLDTVGRTFVQRVNGLGHLLWGSEGIELLGTDAQGGLWVVSDGAGGVVLAYTQGIKAYVQRVSSTGAIQWRTGGVPLSTSTGYQWYPHIIPDGTGGAIAVWYGGIYGAFDIYAQRVDGNGVIQWPAGGVAIAEAQGTQWLPEITSDGIGGAVIAWRDERGSVPQVYAQRVNGSGVVQWPANGIAVCPSPNWQYYFSLVSDGSDGVVITWPENYDVLAQKLTGSGAKAWQTNGIEVAHGLGSTASYPTIANDGTGGFIAIWRQRINNTFDTYAQRLSADGILQWASYGVPLSTFPVYNEYQAEPVLDGRGGVVVPLSLHDPNLGTIQALYAQRLKLDGTLGASSMIGNGGFEQGLAQWSGGGCVTPSIIPNGCNSSSAAKISINGANCNAQFYQHGFTIERGKRYRVSFQAWSSRGEDMRLTVLPHNASTPNLGLDRRVDLGTTPCTNYTFDFTATGSTADARLRFFFNYMSTTGYWYAFDNVSIEQIVPKQGEPEEIAMPTSYALEQNYPNPFNPTTNISFSIPRQTDGGQANEVNVSLKVFDLLGREVATLVNEVRAAGSYTETFNASKLSSGTYFYKLESGSFVQTKKFVLLK